jgi:hypothetical protein
MLQRAEHKRAVERRRFPRYDIPKGRFLYIHPVRALVTDPRCWVENVSRGGCRARGFLPLRRGDTTMMELEFSERSIYVTARVERMTVAEQGPHGWTLVFTGEFQSRCPMCNDLFASPFPPKAEDGKGVCANCNQMLIGFEQDEFAWWWREELGGGD